MTEGETKTVEELRVRVGSGFFLRPPQDFIAAPGMAQAQVNIPGRRVPASRTLPSVVPETPDSEVLQGKIAVPS